MIMRENMEIKILGTGCAKCKALEKLTHEVVEQNGIQTTITKVEELNEIMKYHVMSTPALVVNKNVIAPLLLLPVWFLVYHFLEPVTDWHIEKLIGLASGLHFTEALRFFVFEVPKVLLLLTMIIFVVGID
jgi:small redox-active disulfide protein 2